jgi:hypothetical protein
MENKQQIKQAIFDQIGILPINQNKEFYFSSPDELAEKIYAAIAPILQPKDFPYSKLFDHMANEHDLTLTQGQLGDIIHIARGGGQKTGWEDAPEWAEWQTKDKRGKVDYYSDKPLCREGYTCCWDSLQARPK